MRKVFLVLAIVIVFVLTGVFLFSNKNSQPASQTEMTDSITQGESGTQGMLDGYTGTVIAGKAAPYLDFQKADYEKALADGKVIVLNFYANWCPICRAEAPAIAEGFNLLTTDKVVGFRVNYKDSDTDADEKALAEALRIPYQHTKVILKDGTEVFKETVQWEKEDLVETVNKYL